MAERFSDALVLGALGNTGGGSQGKAPRVLQEVSWELRGSSAGFLEGTGGPHPDRVNRERLMGLPVMPVLVLVSKANPDN